MLILEILYLFSVALLAVYGLNSLLLTWLYRRHHKNSNNNQRPDINLNSVKPTAEVPLVTIQLPVYNERHVVERLINAAVNLNWPVERLQIQVLDDSTDDTHQIIAATLERHRGQGVWLEHICRTDRRGFKAGALQHGLAMAAGEFIAIFDADFIPPPDFLQQTIPCFNSSADATEHSDAVVGCVQARWGHVNQGSSLLTTTQALGIDGHFVVEQATRAGMNAFLNFNGTAGVWRRSCMDDAGGWAGDTLTEDLDLSYRAQLCGWRIVYQPEMVVPAELPVQIDALKRQQFRWAKGSIQTALKLLGKLWRSPQPFWRKLLGTLHLTNYAVHPLMLLNLMLVLPMTLSDSPTLRVAPFLMLSAIGPPLMYWMAMQVQPLPLLARLGRLAMLVGLGTGLSVNNTRAVMEAILGIDSAFKRTPKFAVTGHSADWQTSSYTLPRDPIVWVELVLALYAVGLLGWSISLGLWWLVFWLLLYAGGYSYIAHLSFVQAWQTGTSHFVTSAQKGRSNASSRKLPHNKTIRSGGVRHEKTKP
jgi:cellulose synthase/poly-beta-1,6-N-acetylglucosamine synthase-like glycosyltransferase